MALKYLPFNEDPQKKIAQHDGHSGDIAGAICKSSVIPLLVPRCKVWLTPAAVE